MKYRRYEKPFRKDLATIAGNVMLFGDDVFRLRALLALGHFHRDLLAFFQCFESFHNDRAMVDKDVLAIFTFDKSESLIIVEPLNGSRYTLF